jgi:hypothetical protein
VGGDTLSDAILLVGPASDSVPSLADSYT